MSELITGPIVRNGDGKVSPRQRKVLRLSPEREREACLSSPLSLLSWKIEGLSPQKWNHFCGYADRGIVIFRSRFREIFTARANSSGQMIVLFNLLFWANVKCQLHSSSWRGCRIMSLARWSPLSWSYHKLAILTLAQNLFLSAALNHNAPTGNSFLVDFFGKHRFIYFLARLKPRAQYLPTALGERGEQVSASWATPALRVI